MARIKVPQSVHQSCVSGTTVKRSFTVFYCSLEMRLGTYSLCTAHRGGFLSR